MDALLFLAAAVRISVPYALAAMGASLSERGGVVCIALEGIMLTGALGYTVGAHLSGNPWAGVAAALAGGAFMAWLHAEATVRFRADQITSGLGLNLLAAGLTRFVLVQVFHSSSNSARVAGLPQWHVPVLDRIRASARSSALAAGARHRGARGARAPAAVPHRVRVAPARSRRATRGPRPALGLSVRGIRFTGVLLCGLLAGLAGALASEQHSFTGSMTGRRGYALAAMIVGKWNLMSRSCLPAVRRGRGLQIQLQGSGFPSELLQALPYVVTMLVLAGFIGRAVACAVGVPYDPKVVATAPRPAVRACPIGNLRGHYTAREISPLNPRDSPCIVPATRDAVVAPPEAPNPEWHFSPRIRRLTLVLTAVGALVAPVFADERVTPTGGTDESGSRTRSIQPTDATAPPRAQQRARAAHLADAPRRRLRARGAHHHAGAARLRTRARVAGLAHGDG